MTFAHEQRVYIEDTDAGGIVYYVNYLKFMERARTELMRSLGFGKSRIFNDGVMFVVRDVQIKYLGSAVLDDVIQVTAEPIEVRGARFIVRQRIWRSGELLTDAKVECASVARSSQAPIRMPADMRDQLTALVNKE